MLSFVAHQFVRGLHSDPGIRVLDRQVGDAVGNHLLREIDRDDRAQIGDAVGNGVERGVCLEQRAAPLDVEVERAVRQFDRLVGEPLQRLGPGAAVRAGLADEQGLCLCGAGHRDQCGCRGAQ